MVEDRVREKFSLLQRYVGWQPVDALRLQKAGPFILPDAEELVDDFYAEIVHHHQTSAIMAGGARQVERLKSSLKVWMAELFQGEYGQDYVEKRCRIGKRHVDIGIGPMFVIAALARLRTRMMDTLRQRWVGSQDELQDLILSLNRLLDLDLCLIQDSYEVENLLRIEPFDETGARKHQVLARIGERALSRLPMHSVLDQAVVLVGESFNADRCDLAEFSPGEQNLTLRSGYGWKAELIGRLTVPMEPASIFEYVRQQPRAIAIPDIRRETRFRLGSFLQRHHSISSLWIRLSVEDHFFGTLAVHFRGPRTFSHADYDFLQSVANILSAAMARQEEQARQANSVHRLRRLVDQLPAGALYIAGGAVEVNSAFELMSGFDRGELTSLDDWRKILIRETSRVLPADSSSMEEISGVTHHSAIIRRKDGRERLLDIASFRSTEDEVWLVHDVTEAEDRHERALRAERLVAIGQMITGLAHESRNALQRIRACTELLEFDLESNSSAMELLARIGKAQDDLQRLFDEVRGYASPITLERQECRLASIVEEAWDACEALRVGRTAHLSLPLDDSGVCNLWVDRFRIAQMFRNMFENSLAARPDPVEIEVRCRETVSEDLPFAEIHVIDNGPGLTPEARARIFEPFFTTKSKGTGLGMAIAQRIVELHGGSLKVGDAPERGAEFVIILPRAVH